MAVTPALTDARKEDPEVLALKIAREIAMNLHDVETILTNYKISANQWRKIEKNTFFQRVLQDAIATWNSALNTEQRVKLKSAALFEEWLIEAQFLAHDRTQPLSGKVELMKLLKSTGGMGAGVAGEGAQGERFSVTINLGGDSKLSFTKAVTPQVIEGEVVKEA